MQFRLNDNCDNDQEVHSLFGQVRLACRRACVDSDKIEQSTNSSYKIRSINNDVNNGSHNFISFRKSISNYNNFNVFNNIHLMGIVLLLVTIICSIATPNGQLMSIGPQIKVANALQIKTPAVNIQQHDVKLDEQPLPYWFSFDWFTKKYEKVYTSIESSLRRSLFIGKCVQVFKNKIQFRLGLCTHEEGINQFSDWTKNEYKSMFMKRPPPEEINETYGEDPQIDPSLESRETVSQSANSQGPPKPPPITTINIARSAISDMLHQAKDRGAKEVVEAILDELQQLSPIEQKSQSPKNANDNVIDGTNGEDVYKVPPMDPIAKHRSVKRRDKKSNEDQPSNDDLHSKSSRRRETQQQLTPIDEAPPSDFAATRQSSLDIKLYRPPKLPEHMGMVNWSLHECFHEVYDQGKKCGQCYVMASTAMAEFYKCAETEHWYKRKFSKNYVINCVQNFSSRNYGCDGGSIVDVMNFIAYSGVWTVKDWKNKLLEAEEQEPDLFKYDESFARCPIDGHAVPLESWGKIKIDITPKLVWPYQWMDYITQGPMAVIVSMPDGADNYVRGVHAGTGCVKSRDWHSMILVGYGRENGQDFWLFRNSWGPGWGEQGHFKLSTQVPHECLHTGVRVIREPWYPFPDDKNAEVNYMSLAEASSS